MVVPRQHGTKGAQGRRRSHMRLKSLSLVFCEKCGTEKMSHRMCKNCGFYKQSEIINVVARELKKKQKKLKS